MLNVRLRFYFATNLVYVSQRTLWVTHVIRPRELGAMGGGGKCCFFSFFNSFSENFLFHNLFRKRAWGKTTQCGIGSRSHLGICLQHTCSGKDLSYVDWWGWGWGWSEFGGCRRVLESVVTWAGSDTPLPVKCGCSWQNSSHHQQCMV